MEDMIVYTPESILELQECLSIADNDTYLISGGTDLLIKIKNHIGKIKLIDLTGINDIKGITETETTINIGAGTILSQISSDERLIKLCPALVEASSQVGSTQIRNIATLAGNIANASPCADTFTPLLAYDAKVKTLNKEGETFIKNIDEIIEGAGKNLLTKDEAIIEIMIPKKKGYISAFDKIGSRKAVTISKINITLLLKTNENAKIEDAKVTLGALGPKAIRGKIAEQALIGKRITTSLVVDFCKALSEEVDRAIPNRSSRHYKRIAIKGIGQDVINKLIKQLKIDTYTESKTEELFGGDNHE